MKQSIIVAALLALSIPAMANEAGFRPGPSFSGADPERQMEYALCHRLPDETDGFAKSKRKICEENGWEWQGEDRSS